LGDTAGVWSSVPLSPPLNFLTYQISSSPLPISFFPFFTPSAVSRLAALQLILLSICFIPWDRSIFYSVEKKKVVALPYFLDSRWDPSQGPSQIGAFPEIRLTAPSPAPTSDLVDPLRTSDSPAERSACRRTVPPPAPSH
ncbi:uncharacterized protein N7529_001729, partial [Penicillium soppii]|uniref:uncharacterized protein n=1 Tax=Penicillium soppii TaxID=69789 RepID=UPI0025479CF6